jgi:hypothetical protein
VGHGDLELRFPPKTGRTVKVLSLLNSWVKAYIPPSVCAAPLQLKLLEGLTDHPISAASRTPQPVLTGDVVWSVTGATPKPSQQRSRKHRFKALDGRALLQRLNLNRVDDLPAYSSLVIGAVNVGKKAVRKLAASESLLQVTEPMLLATHKRRQVLSRRPDESRARRDQLKPGEEFSFDATGRMPTSLDGYHYSFIFVCMKTDRVKVFHVREKTTASLLAAIEELRVWVLSEIGVVLKAVFGDFDPVWSVQLRGDDVEPALVKAYRQKHPIQFRRAPRDRQAFNPAEGTMGPMYSLMSANCKRGRLSLDKAWPDMLDAAEVQINLHLVPRSKRGSAARLMTRIEAFHGKRYDVTRLITYPGGLVYVHNVGSKSSRDDDRARAGYFVCPAESTGGFIVRMHHSLKLVNAYDVSVVNNPNAIVATLMASDALYREHGVARGREETARAALRDLYVSDPTAMDLDSTLVIKDPLTGAPIALVPALTADGERTMVPPEDTVETPIPNGAQPCTANGTLGMPDTATDVHAPTTSPTHPLDTSALDKVFADVAAEVEKQKKTKKSGRASARLLRLLPANTGLTFIQQSKKGKNAKNYEAYRVAKTLTDLANLQASGQWNISHLGWDLVHGYVKLNRDPSGCDAATTLGSLLPPQSTRGQRRRQARTSNPPPSLSRAGVGVRPPQRGARTRSQTAILPPEGAVYRVDGIEDMTRSVALALGATDLDHRLAQAAARTGVAPGAGVCDCCSTERGDDGSRASTTDEKPPRPASSTTAPRKRKRQRKKRKPDPVALRLQYNAEHKEHCREAKASQSAAAAAVKSAHVNFHEPTGVFLALGGLFPAATKTAEAARQSRIKDDAAAAPAASLTRTAAEKQAARKARPEADALASFQRRVTKKAAQRVAKKKRGVTKAAKRSAQKKKKMEEFAAIAGSPPPTTPATARTDSAEGGTAVTDSSPTHIASKLATLRSLMLQVAHGADAAVSLEDCPGRKEMAASFENIVTQARARDASRDAALAAVDPVSARLSTLQDLEGMPDGPGVQEQAAELDAAILGSNQPLRPNLFPGGDDCASVFYAAAQAVDAEPTAAFDFLATGSSDELMFGATMMRDFAYVAELETFDDAPSAAAYQQLVHAAEYDGAASTFVEELPGRFVGAVQAGDVVARGVLQGKKLPDWLGPGGYREAVEAEIKRVTEHYKAVAYVPESEVRAARSQYGPDKVSIQHLVFPLKEKRNAAGVVTRRKGRITVADKVSAYKLSDTFSANILPVSQRVLSQLQVILPGAVSLTSDVGGAYYNGKPKKVTEPGGRVLFAPVPKGWEEFGFPAEKDGQRMYFRVDGNMPGRQDAGKVWSEQYTSDLLSWGFTQSVVDRRVFYQFDDEGKALVVGVFVDDNWILNQSPKLFRAFQAKWSAKFDGAPDMAATEGEFCGVGSERVDENTVRLHVDKGVDDLGVKLEPHPLPNGVSKAEPMAADGLRAIMEKPSDANPKQPDTLLAEARSIMGLGGWIVCMLRADAFFAFTALATQLAKNFTRKVWHAVLQWAHYIVDTKWVRLTYRTSPEGGKALTFADSSLINAENGGSFGGFCSCYEGSGVFDWRCFVPRRLADSSAGAELIMSSAAVKNILGNRMFLKELGQEQEGPSALYLDAQAVLNGAEMERVSREMRYQAARYAMLRDAQQAKTVELKKVPTADNLADIFTKPLVGPQFRHLRSMVMGIEPWSVAHEA